MKKSQMLSALNATFFATFSIIAEASIVWDYSPATTGGDGVTNWGNFSTDQNFAETIIFSQPIRITGMDIYSATGQGVVGDSATIRLWTDDQGVPDQLIQNFAETITVVDSDGIGSVFDITRKHVNFSAPVFLSAGTTYWIGMSGTDLDTTFSQMGLATNPPADSRMAQFTATTFQFITDTSIGDMAFRLHGTVVPIPPAIWLFSSGLLGIIGISRHQKSV